MNQLIQISVDHAYRSNNGWFVECSDGIERFVHERDMLKHLGAVKGMIEVSAPSIGDDERTEFITLDEWAADNAGLEIESVLSVIINRAEQRTIYRPLTATLDALQPLRLLASFT
jgi:hypothetical protein